MSTAVLSLAAAPAAGRKRVVSVGAWQVSNDPCVRLLTYALGSCLGITIYDPVTRTGGLLHAMLPESSLNRAKAAQQPALFVDTGMAELLRAVREFPIDKKRLQVCAAGAAQLMRDDALFRIGQRNYTSFRAVLRQHGLQLQAAAVGGKVSRTISLDLGSGEVLLKCSNLSGETVLFQG